MKTFKVKHQRLCPYRIPSGYCNHLGGPVRCESDDFPEDCPGDDVEVKEEEDL